jgi:hypothetical protein
MEGFGFAIFPIAKLLFVVKATFSSAVTFLQVSEKMIS